MNTAMTTAKLLSALLLLGATAFLSLPSGVSAHTVPDPVCTAVPDPDPPVYYAIDLVGTRKVPGARQATGTGDVTFAHSPFGVALAPDGQYVYNLAVAMEKVSLREGKVLDAWVTTPSLDQIRYLGRLDEAMQTSGTVDWNKFLVVITLEDADSEPGDRWSGAIVARGMSRSGLMHTMAGHGPFQTEPCSVYGYR